MPYERKTSDIFISDDLRNILTEIESQSMVASLLLKRRHSNEDLVEDFVNHISVSREDKGKISYLTKERFAAIDESEIWTSSRRFQAKPGGFISKVFKDIPAKEVELFSTLKSITEPFASLPVKAKIMSLLVAAASAAAAYVLSGVV